MMALSEQKTTRVRSIIEQIQELTPVELISLNIVSYYLRNDSGIKAYTPILSGMNWLSPQ